jgi:hypothetical protein
MKFYKRIEEFFVPSDSKMLEILLEIFFLSGVSSVVFGPILRHWFKFSSESFILGAVIATFFVIKSEHRLKLRKIKKYDVSPERKDKYSKPADVLTPEGQKALYLLLTETGQIKPINQLPPEEIDTYFGIKSSK